MFLHPRKSLVFHNLLSAESPPRLNEMKTEFLRLVVLRSGSQWSFTGCAVREGNDENKALKRLDSGVTQKWVWLCLHGVRLTIDVVCHVPVPDQHTSFCSSSWIYMLCRNPARMS